MAISFHNEDISYRIPNKRLLKAWIKACVEKEKRFCGDIHIILCSDDYLLKMNHDYLHHDYYTDIITFNYNVENRISGDLFISLDRIKENALKNRVETIIELQRVIIHGVMHLCGYNDKKKSDTILMRAMEEKCLKSLIKMQLASVSRGTKILK